MSFDDAEKIRNLDVSNADLGSPKAADCLNAAYQFPVRGNVVLNPANGPFIRTAGKSLPADMAKPELISDLNLCKAQEPL